MSTYRVSVMVAVIAGSLLAAGAALASDVTADQPQAAAKASARSEARKSTAQPVADMSPMKGHDSSCHCSQAASVLSPEDEAELDRLRSQGG